MSKKFRDYAAFSAASKMAPQLVSEEKTDKSLGGSDLESFITSFIDGLSDSLQLGDLKNVSAENPRQALEIIENVQARIDREKRTARALLKLLDVVESKGPKAIPAIGHS